MPRLPKPLDQRQRRNFRADAGTLPELDVINVPNPSKLWRKNTVDEWDSFWSSPLVALVNPGSDLPALRRLFDYRDDLDRAHAEIRKVGVQTDGSRGQTRMHPLISYAVNLEKMIAPLEDRFGLSPLSRLKLGAQLSDVKKSLNEDLQAEEMDEDGDTSDIEYLSIVQLPGVPHSG